MCKSITQNPAPSNTHIHPETYQYPPIAGCSEVPRTASLALHLHPVVGPAIKGNCSSPVCMGICRSLGNLRKRHAINLLSPNRNWGPLRDDNHSQWFFSLSEPTVCSRLAILFHHSYVGFWPVGVHSFALCMCYGLCSGFQGNNQEIEWYFNQIHTLDRDWAAWDD